MEFLSPLLSQLGASRANRCRCACRLAKCSLGVSPSRQLHVYPKKAVSLRLTEASDLSDTAHQGDTEKKHTPLSPWADITRQRGTFKERDRLRRDRGQDSRSRSRYRNDTTMTNKERSTFNRLFKKIGKSKSQQEYNSIHRPLDESDSGSTSTEEMAKLQAYPPAIRGMAAEARLLETLDNTHEDESQTPQKKEMNIFQAPIRKKVFEARSDIEIWNVIETELFARIRERNLDGDFSLKSQASSNDRQDDLGERIPEKEALAPAASEPSLHVLSTGYRNMLILALRTLCRRTSYTPLPFALLPAIKSLGPSSFAMAVQPALFNELLLYHWRTKHTMSPLISLLEEMDSVSCPMDLVTLDTLQEVVAYHHAAKKGSFGIGNQEVEMMPERMRQAQQLVAWRKKIQLRLHDAQMEKLKRKEQLEALESEGAIGDAEDSDPLSDRLAGMG